MAEDSTPGVAAHATHLLPHLEAVAEQLEHDPRAVMRRAFPDTDPGSGSRLATLLEALGDERPRALLLAHVHLAHDGASGSLVRRWPEIEVHEHECAARHLVDPSRLLEIAGWLSARWAGGLDSGSFTLGVGAIRSGVGTDG